MTDDETNKCNHGKGEYIYPPIYWNSFNRVFQCHKCGQAHGGRGGEAMIPIDPKVSLFVSSDTYLAETQEDVGK